MVSIVSCFISDDEMQFRKLATLHEYQGRGIASEVLNYIFDFARHKNLKRVWFNASSNKKIFMKNSE
ncbi:GNAT family N-acetyltransferase [Flavobacterium sp.]|uniref:GNAT family N-acetyltransferase n=1 Tax=Flavobacterium sp. TaxID=239 RepID=UPI003265D7F4